MPGNHFIESIKLAGSQIHTKLEQLIETVQEIEKNERAIREECENDACRFNREQNILLYNQGYNVYHLTGKSIASLRAEGWPFGTTWHQTEAFENKKSHSIDVAINLEWLFLPNSHTRTLIDHEKMVAQFGKEIGSDINGTTAIIGSVSDYAELAFAHFDLTGEYLFGYNYGFMSTRTSLTAGMPHVAIGNFGPDFQGQNSLNITAISPGDKGARQVLVAPLVIPISALSNSKT